MPPLYLTQQGSVLKREGERLIVTKDDQVLADIPVIKVDQVVIMGNIKVTTPVITLLLQQEIDLVYLSSRGRYRGRLVGTGSGFAQLRHIQVQKAALPSFALEMAKRMIHGKLANQQALLRKYGPAVGKPLSQAITGIGDLARRVEGVKDIETLRGLEGQAAVLYFQGLRELLQQDLGFQRRVQHPPTDPVNSLLSFGYTLLLNDLVAAIHLVGMDPFIGFFHVIDYGRPSLALDLEEEFRPTIVDTLVLEIVNQRLMTQGDFQKPKNPDEMVRLSDAARNRYLEIYEQRVNTRVVYPPTQEENSYRRILELQTRHLARVIQDRDKTYCPMTYL